MEFEILKSEVDASVNFVHRLPEPGEALEARYVRRHEDYVACYLSSQGGCAQACRFCWLTATGQNKLDEIVTMSEVVQQANVVLDYYRDNTPPAKYVHFNFMARGDFFDNPMLLAQNQDLFRDLAYAAQNRELLPRFLLSTILPNSLEDPGSYFQTSIPEGSLTKLFPVVQPEIYYSLYSMNPEFRRRWLPRAMDPDRALSLLTEWQRYSKKIIRIHYALIRGQNDSLEDAHRVVEAITKHGLRADFTLVRYNPPKPGHSEEADNYESYMAFLRSAIAGVRVKSLNRVGPDVMASCGQFVNVR